MSLAARIRLARSARGLSQAQLATACGWDSVSRISNYEQGTREPALADIRVMADALWVAESWLLTGNMRPTSGGSYRVLGDVLAVDEYPTNHRLAGKPSPWPSQTAADKRVIVDTIEASTSQPARFDDATMKQAIDLLYMISDYRPDDRRFARLTWPMIQVAAKAVSRAEAGESPRKVIAEILAEIDQGI